MSAIKAAVTAAIVLVIGVPNPFPMMMAGIVIPADAKRATPSPRYRRRNANESDTDWDAYKAAVKADADGRQTDLLMSIARAIGAGADVTIILTQGATDYGQDLFSDVAAPDLVLTFVDYARKNGAKIVDVEPLLSARVSTVTVLAAPSGQAENPPI